MPGHTISKSRYLSGYQCLKKLYIEKHHPDMKPAVSLTRQALFDQGTAVGELARRYFAGGQDATPESYYDFGPSIANTARWIEGKEPVIYEAAFQSDGVLAALDILVLSNGDYLAVEVKSTTEVKDYHVIDGSLQYWVMRECGITPDKFYLMHINNKYVRQGDLDIEQLFTLTDITDQVKALQDEVPVRIEEMKTALQQDAWPEVDIGSHCSSPFSCDFTGHCWQHVPDESVFGLSRLRSDKAWAYYQQGILAIADLPEDHRFSERQRMQIAGVRHGSQTLKPDRIKAWISELKYPLYFFDFETINPGIPLYDNSRPYQSLPVQYSLHVVDSQDSVPRHHEFLPDFKEDPRPALIRQMIANLGEEGDIVAYNVGFEKGKIKDLAKDFPEYADKLHAISERFVDLAIPFMKGWYYTPEMQGRYSIKYVYPAIIHNAEVSYSSLAISNGEDASVYLKALAEGRVKPEDVESLRKDLLAYCKLDTQAMVDIWLKLHAVSAGQV